MSEDEYFAKLAEAVNTLHKLTHATPDSPMPIPAADLAQIVAALSDVLVWLTSSASWEARRLTSYDRALLRYELTDKVAWRLQ